jgi:hypothetical protein
MKSVFDIVVDTEHLIILRDKFDEYPPDMHLVTITNGAEDIIYYLHRNEILKNRRLAYFGTDNRLFELKYKMENGRVISLEFNPTEEDECLMLDVLNT